MSKFVSIYVFSLGIFFAAAPARALPACNIKLANEFRCEKGTRYICQLNGHGSMDADSGKWKARGKCKDEQSAEAADEHDEG